ncbi:alginate O-acetyltransferase AlgX-related protein [Palleronia sp. KMU-117]|uniref:alginate O-acetyltransferase AlgX-related protein n=1 Tax=Palleronia sp. KMU-117 TaxID=3434108 RepID=UPI003D730D25
MIGLAATLCTLVAIPGVFALAAADARVSDARVFDGAYQRIYEERFERELPGRDLAIHLWNALGLALLGEVAEGAVLGEDGWIFTAEEFQAPQDTRDVWAELERARDVLSAQGIRLVPVIVPDKARIMAAHLPRQRSPRFDLRYQTLLDGLQARGYPAIDLRQALSAGRDAAVGFMKTDTHWSPAGAARAARQIADALGPTGLPVKDFASRRVDEAGFDGDLLAFADVGPFRARFSILHETIEVFETNEETASSGGTALDLFGDAEVPVALVGTSYSARSEFHFEGFLKSELDADLVNHAEAGLGPFVPMDRFLASLADTAPRPQLVIWEIPERYLNTWRIE